MRTFSNHVQVNTFHRTRDRFAQLLENIGINTFHMTHGLFAQLLKSVA